PVTSIWMAAHGASSTCSRLHTLCLPQLKLLPDGLIRFFFADDAADILKSRIYIVGLESEFLAFHHQICSGASLHSMTFHHAVFRHISGNDIFLRIRSHNAHKADIESEIFHHLQRQ